MVAPRHWAGRTALVTGASRGIGAAVARTLAEQGATVALVARDLDALASVAQDCDRRAPDDTPPAHQLAVDVTDAMAVEEAVAEVRARFDDRLDLLANVAGASLRPRRVEEASDADYEAELALNLLAHTRLMRLAFPALQAARGAVVNVGSIAASRGAPLSTTYAAAKAGLAAVGRVAAVEWARHGIRVTTVEPGFVDTAFNDGLREAGLEERFLARVPTREAIRPEEIARVVLLAGDPEGRGMTGTVLTVDGGLGARL